jgi:hypothetical protein
VRGGKRDGAGRPSGSRNRITSELVERIKAQCGEEFDPVLGMAKLAQDELNSLERDDDAREIIDLAAKGEDLADLAMRLKAVIKAQAANRAFALQALAEVAQYVHAKRKAVEVSGEGGGAVTFEMVLPA